MSMTIIPKGTNDKMLVNYANVISIFTMENTTVVDTETDDRRKRKWEKSLQSVTKRVA